MNDFKSTLAKLQIQMLAEDSAIIGLTKLAVEDSYAPQDRHLGVVVRNHSSPYQVRLLRGGIIVYAEYNGSHPVPEGSLVTVDMRETKRGADVKGYRRGSVVKAHPYVRLKV